MKRPEQMQMCNWQEPRNAVPKKHVVVAAIFADGTLIGAARHDDGWWAVETPDGELIAELDNPPVFWAPLPKQS